MICTRNLVRFHAKELPRFCDGCNLGLTTGGSTQELVNDVTSLEINFDVEEFS